MGWEQRGNRPYFYRKIRKGRTVKSEYVPALAVPLVEAQDLKRRAARQAERSRRDKLDDLDRELDELIASIDQLVIAQLLTEGYYRHRRQWRKRGESLIDRPTGIQQR